MNKEHVGDKERVVENAKNNETVTASRIGERMISRRSLLAAVGAAGAVLASGGLMSGAGAASASTVSESVYGPGPDCHSLSCGVSVKQYGAAGDQVTDDSAALQTAIDDLPEGGNLCFPPGTYRIGANLTFPKQLTLVLANGAILAPDVHVTVTILSGLEASLSPIFAGGGLIQGPINAKGVYPHWWGAAGNGTTDATAAFNSALAAADHLVIPEHDSFLIGGVELAGKKVSGAGTIVKLQSNECAFHVKGDGTVLEGLRFRGQHTSGQPSTDIKLGDGSTNIRIHACTFQSSIYSAIAGAVDSSQPGGGDYAQAAQGVLIANNVFEGYARPLYLHSVNNITITGNIIRDTQYDGIRLRENDGFCLIDGNQFINIGNPSWPDNQTRDAVDSHWSGKDLTITNNIVDTTACLGFDLKGVSPNRDYGSSRVIVANNQITRTRFSGIRVSPATTDPAVPHISFYQISGNIIHECNLNNQSGQGSIGDAGILLNRVKHVNVVDNFVFSCYGRGIFVHNPNTKAESGGDEELKNKFIRIVGNICVNNGQADRVNTCAGIMSLGTGYLIVAQNQCENDSSYPNFNMQGIGISISSAAAGFTNIKNAILRDNICRNNANYQILISGAASIAVMDGNIQEGPNAAYRSWHHQRGTFHGTGIPPASDGQFRAGDVIFNIAPTRTRNISHWICAADGAPGTWMACGSGWGTTAERPALTSSDAGYQYMDTTLGSMVLWDGNVWQGT